MNEKSKAQRKTAKKRKKKEDPTSAVSDGNPCNKTNRQKDAALTTTI